MSLLLMLEDDRERIRRFMAVLASRRPSIDLLVARTAQDFRGVFLSHSAKADLICLDHDLFPDAPGDPDPGDGRDVSGFLATQRPSCPVLIHSSNSHAADSMMFSMRDAGWTVERVSPLGDDWIEAYWYPVAVEMLAKGVAPDDSSEFMGRGSG